MTDHTATGYAADLDTSPCTTRAYTFDGNSRRTTLVSTVHPDGTCDSVTGTTTTTADWTGRYDTADRPTTTTGGAAYVYDTFGRQTTLPAADTPTYAGTTVPAGNHDLTIGYYDDDQPKAVTQDGTTTTYTLDNDGHRTVETNTDSVGAVTGTQTNHYTDASDNPTWTDTTTGGVTTTARYAESISGDLCATLAPDGAATLPLATLHGDTVTTVALPATQDAATAATSCSGWADYTEYGAAKDTAAAAAVGGTRGYGWLGAKQRSTTTTFSAGLTLMGDRLYNAARGLFTATDPEPGGSANTYAYPTDPINNFDLDGHFWGQSKWNAFTAFGRRHASGLSRLGRVAGWVSTAASWCPMAQCQSVAVGAGLVSAGAYAWAGRRREANAALNQTLLNFATGGRGQWVRKASRFKKLNGRYSGIFGLAARSYRRSGGSRAHHVVRAGANFMYNFTSWSMSRGRRDL